MGKLYGLIVLWFCLLVDVTTFAQCPNTLSVRISQVGQPTAVAYNSFCQGEQVQLNVVGGRPGLAYQWKRNGEDLPNGTSETYLAGQSGFYTVTARSNLGCTITSLPVTIEVINCQPSGRVRIRGGYFDDFNYAAFNTDNEGKRGPYLRVGFYTYKSELNRFPLTLNVNVYRKSDDRLITTVRFERRSIVEDNLLSIEGACGIEETQLYDVLYFTMSPLNPNQPEIFNLDPATYTDPAGYYFVSEGVCCRETIDNIQDVNSQFVSRLDFGPRSAFSFTQVNQAFGAAFNVPAKVEGCLGNPITINYLDIINGGLTNDAVIIPKNITRTRYSLETPITLSGSPINYVPGYSATNFAGPGLQIDPNTGTLTGTPTRPGRFAYVVKAETFNGNTRLAEIRREIQLVVKECPTTPQPVVQVTKNPICPGETTQLTIRAGTGVSGGAYQWYRDGKLVSGATSTTLLADGAGQYTVSATKETACPPFALSEPLTLSVSNTSVTLTQGASQGGDCQNNTVQLSALANVGESGEFRWFRDGTFLTGVAGPTYSTSVAGQYTVQIATQPTGCTAVSGPVTLVAGAGPVVAPTITVSTSAICPGRLAILSATEQTGLTYQWLSGGQPVPGATTSVLSVTQPGTYAVRVQTAQSCSVVSQPTTVSGLTPPTIAINGGVQVCAGSSTTLTLANPNISTNGWQFSWQRNGTTAGTFPSHQTSSAGTYRLRITDANGCTAVSPDWLVAQTNAITVQIAPMTPVCLSPGTPVSLSASPPGGTFSGPGVTGTVFTPAVAGVGTHAITYSLSGATSCESGIASQTIEVRPSPTFTLPTQLTTLLGTPVVLPGPPGTGWTYSWSPPSSLSSPTAQSPTANPTQTTLYQLQVKDTFGCIAEGLTLLVVVTPDVKLFIPNAFTPNGDQNNDTWKLWGAEAFPDLDVTVFDRWGEVIYHSIGYERAFDGYYRNERVPSGVYTYVIRYDPREKPLRGTVMVIY
ncbi:MAG: hypothetical protein EAZ91_07915 [Cytophagales bacterium]|nr:MAG: hypothetical protein EAZ91_07915 [Cytophagales bacterium]